MAGKWDLALEFFGSVPADVAPDVATFTELAGALEKAKSWTKSLQILSMALSIRLVPDGTCAGSIAGAVADACGEASAMLLLREMLKKWRETRGFNHFQEGVEDTLNASVQGTGVELLTSRPGLVVLVKPSGLSTETMMEMVFGRLWSARLQTVSRKLGPF